MALLSPLYKKKLCWIMHTKPLNIEYICTFVMLVNSTVLHFQIWLHSMWNTF